MDLEKINNQYVRLKAKLESTKKDVEKLKEDLELKTSDLQILEASKTKARINKDIAREQAIATNIANIKKDIKKIKDEAEVKAEEWKEIQEKIDKRIEEIKENPELKKHLDEVLVKKYDRKMRKIEAEKKIATDKRERLNGLNELAEKHPSVRKNLIGMTNAIKEINTLNAELTSLKQPIAGGLFRYTDQARADEITKKLIPIAKSKYEKNMTLLTDYAKTQKIKIDTNDLKELTENMSHNKGKIDISGTIGKQVKLLDKKIKGFDKSIANYKGAIGNFDNSIVKNVQKQSIQNTQPAKQSWFGKIVNRFKDWNNRRKQRALPEGEQAVDSKKDKKEKNEFVSSLKYDIVKDEVARMERDGLKEAKAQRKVNEDYER